jgi:hypothetical protein
MATDDGPARRRRALLIASASYVDPGLAALRAPTGDVDALAGVLGDEEIGGFEVERLVDEPTDTVKKRIEDFFRDSRRQDLLLFYFSGHGVLAQDRRFYFATASTELQWVRTTAIDDRFVNEAMDQSRARSIVVLLDCCHSGAFGKGLVPKSALTAGVEHRFDGHGRVTLTASDELEYAFEETDPTSIDELGPAAPGSLFTRCLVEGLRSGEADVDRDGAISVDDLYDYVKQKVRERSAHQSPRMSGSVSGDIVIARSVRPAEAPPPAPPVVPPAVPPPGRRTLSRRALAVIGIGAAALAAVVAALLVLPGSGDDDRGGGAAASSAIPYAFGSGAGQTIVLGAAGGSSAGGARRSGAVVLHPDEGAASSLTSTDAGVPTARPGDRYGAALASADFDNNGYADLAIGVPGRDLVAVLYGSADGLARRGAPLAARQIEGAAPVGGFGAALAAGDLDGDDVADLIVGSPGTRDDYEANAAGAVYAFAGSSDGLSAARMTMLGPPDGSQLAFGRYLTVGDVNGDDNLDVVEGARDEPDFDVSGHLSRCLGQDGGPTACEQVPGSNGLGTSALAVADLGDDGVDEVVQGDEAPGDGAKGVVRIFSDPATEPVVVIDAATPGVHVRGASGEGFGHAVAAGDLDSDGMADMVIGAPQDGAGSVTVIGGARGVATRADSYRLPRPDDFGNFGEAVTVLDVDGDRHLDVVVASGGGRRLDDVLFVYKGTATGIDLEAPVAQLGGMGDIADVAGSPLVLGG